VLGVPFFGTFGVPFFGTCGVTCVTLWRNHLTACVIVLDTLGGLAPDREAKPADEVGTRVPPNGGGV